VGFQLLKDLAHHVVSIQPSHPDRLVGHAFALGLPDNDSEEYSAVQRALAERWPDLQWGANLPSTALSQGRFDVATRELQAWMARAPGQREAWQVLARVNVLQGRPPGPLELLFEADPVLLMALDFLWLVSGDLDRVSDGAGRISVASPRYRAMAQYLLALVDVLKGQLNSAAERLDRAWTLADGHVSGNSFSWTQVTREARRIAEVLGRADAVTRWRQREVEAFERFAWPAPISAANAWATAAQTGTCPAQGPYVDRVAALERTNAARFITRVASTRGCATCAEVLRQGVSPTFEGLLPWTTEYLRCAAEAGAVEVALPLAARSTQVTSVAISGTFDAAVVDTLLARYWHARLLERSGARDAAKAQYGAFLDAWGKADFKSREVQDAAARLAALK
jgi:hypothetical protein